MNKIQKQSYKPTNILIHITDKSLKNSIDLSGYKNLRISYYINTIEPSYPVNTLVKVSNIKYKLRLDERTEYDDQFIKKLIIKEVFK